MSSTLDWPSSSKATPNSFEGEIEPVDVLVPAVTTRCGRAEKDLVASRAHRAAALSCSALEPARRCELVVSQHCRDPTDFPFICHALLLGEDGLGSQSAAMKRAGPAGLHVLALLIPERVASPLCRRAPMTCGPLCLKRSRSDNVTNVAREPLPADRFRPH
jgi:hypothetical protein